MNLLDPLNRNVTSWVCVSGSVRLCASQADDPDHIYWWRHLGWRAADEPAIVPAILTRFRRFLLFVCNQRNFFCSVSSFRTIFHANQLKFQIKIWSQGLEKWNISAIFHSVKLNYALHDSFIFQLTFDVNFKEFTRKTRPPFNHDWCHSDLNFAPLNRTKVARYSFC